ncbi:unnamed protein product [Prorocentrum cordatum]|uniref:Uncharacterized protein n=1 Tax=Prorocentrum cordatum TaxID=2364126 RepID=A0ABN9QV10_9DINO|nr:unnamed protein product [Polarella glacialis]
MQDPDALLAAFRSLFPSVLHCVLMEDTRKLHMQKTLGKTAGALRCFCCHHRAKARYKEGLRRAASLEQEFRHNVRRAHEMVEYGGKVQGRPDRPLANHLLP